MLRIACFSTVFPLFARYVALLPRSLLSCSCIYGHNYRARDFGCPVYDSWLTFYDSFKSAARLRLVLPSYCKLINLNTYIPFVVNQFSRAYHLFRLFRRRNGQDCHRFTCVDHEQGQEPCAHPSRMFFRRCLDACELFLNLYFHFASVPLCVHFIGKLHPRIHCWSCYCFRWRKLDVWDWKGQRSRGRQIQE